MIKPLGDRVVIELLAEKEKTPGGLWIPDDAKEKQSRGRVIAVGMGCGPDVKVDKEVLFGKYAGTEITFGAVSYLIVKEEDILAVV